MKPIYKMFEDEIKLGDLTVKNDHKSGLSIHCDGRRVCWLNQHGAKTLAEWIIAKINYDENE